MIAIGPFLLAATSNCALCAHGVEDQCGMGGHTWESEIMPARCRRFCTPDSGRRGWCRWVRQITQQPCLFSQLLLDAYYLRQLYWRGKLNSPCLSWDDNYSASDSHFLAWTNRHVTHWFCICTAWSDVDHLLSRIVSSPAGLDSQTIFSNPGNDFLKFQELGAKARQQACRTDRSPPVAAPLLSIARWLMCN